MLINLKRVYFAYVFSNYIYFRNKPDNCFKDNLSIITLSFLLIFIGFVTLYRVALSILMIFTCFSFFVYMFYSDPQSFYTQVGMDPQIIDNLPTIKADQTKLSDCNYCVICTYDIEDNQDILQLKCNNKYVLNIFKYYIQYQINIRHLYHSECIKDWLKTKLTCPICKSTNIL